MIYTTIYYAVNVSHYITNGLFPCAVESLPRMVLQTWLHQSWYVAQYNLEDRIVCGLMCSYWCFGYWTLVSWGSWGLSPVAGAWHHPTPCPRDWTLSPWRFSRYMWHGWLHIIDLCPIWWSTSEGLAPFAHFPHVTFTYFYPLLPPWLFENMENKGGVTSWQELGLPERHALKSPFWLALAALVLSLSKSSWNDVVKRCETEKLLIFCDVQLAILYRPISCQCVLQGSDLLQSDTEETPENLVKNGDFESGPDKSIPKDDWNVLIHHMHWLGRLMIWKNTKATSLRLLTKAPQAWTIGRSTMRWTGGTEPTLTISTARSLSPKGISYWMGGDHNQWVIRFASFCCLSSIPFSSVFAAHCNLFRFCLALLVALT